MKPNEQLLEFYKTSQLYFDQVDQHDNTYFKHYIDLVKPNRPGGINLDVGCGTGFVTLELARQGCKGIGIDVSEIGIKRANKRRDKYGLKSLATFAISNASQIPFGNGRFESVGIYSSIEHFSTPEETLMEMVRVLEPGGRLVIFAPNYITPINDINDRIDDTSLKGAFKYLVRRLIRKNFYGNLFLLIGKELGFNSKLYFREIDVKSLTACGGDEDAIFLCNPMDIIRILMRAGLRIEFFSSFGYRSPRINGIIRVINKIPFIRFMGWGTFVMGRKVNSSEPGER